MPNTFTNYILNKIYGMSKPQFHHLSSIIAGLEEKSAWESAKKVVTFEKSMFIGNSKSLHGVIKSYILYCRA